MAKAIELEKHLANSGPWGAPTIEHLRKKLRLAGMLQCSGQGYAARDIVASDVTAYFLGLVAADERKNVPAAIRLARAAAVYLSASGNCDPWPFVGVPKETTLGEFLDALFAGEISSASEPGFSMWNMRFEIQITAGDFWQFATLIFEIGDESHTIKFFGLNEAVRASLDSGQEGQLPTQSQVDRVCVVRTKFLGELIAFTKSALNPASSALDNHRSKISADNPFAKFGRRRDYFASNDGSKTEL